MTLQEYLGQEYAVVEVVHPNGKVSFNVKRDGFEYATIKYNKKQLGPSIIKMIGLTVETKYGSWKFLQEMK